MPPARHPRHEPAGTHVAATVRDPLDQRRPGLERSVISVALDQELRAGEVLGLHLSALPPVLHSTEYAAAQPSVRGAAAMNVCDARWRSQLHTGLADRYHLVIGSAALAWIRTRTPRMAHNQIAHLIRLIDQHRAALHLLPEDVPRSACRQTP